MKRKRQVEKQIKRKKIYQIKFPSKLSSQFSAQATKFPTKIAENTTSILNATSFFASLRLKVYP